MTITIKQIIEQCGGTKLLSKNCNTQAQSVNKWKYNNGIPEKHWSTIIKLYGADLTPAILHKLNESIRND
jgi:hypothetical protein